MTTPADQLLGPLLDALLAARTQPAADKFDEAVSAAVAEGSLSADLARQLRYWQRASLHEVADHVRTVLPAVLPGALAAVSSSAQDATESASAATDVWSGRHAEPAVPLRQASVHSQADVPVVEEAVLSAPDVIVLPAELPEEDDASNHHARRRLFVAGLTSTA